MIKDRSYYQVCGWMINKLHLQGHELQCYAIIYSLSQTGEGRFVAGLSYLAEFMQVTQPTASKALRGLFKKGLIEKEEIVTQTGRRVYYIARDEEKGVHKNFMDGVNKDFIDGVNKNFIPINNNYNSTINSPINEGINTPTPTRMSDDELNREQGLLLGNSQWIEVICMKHKITLDTFRDMVADFILDCRCNAQNRHQDEQDLRSHFNNWLRIKLQSNGNNRPNINAGYRKPSPEDNIRTVEQWALEQTRKCLSGEADRERERLSEGLPF